MINIKSGYDLYIVAMLINVLILLLVYPGFMSYDSLHALREARFGVEGGSYPPYVSYVWRPLDKLWPGPSLMLLVQNGLLLFSLAHILRLLGLGLTWAGYAIMIFCASFPPLMGSMVVVWKDVAVAACFMAVVAISMQICIVKNKVHRHILLLCGLAMVFSGMAYRFNAASGALPLIICLFWVTRTNTVNKQKFRQRIACISLALVVFVGLFSLVMLINTYKIPTLEKFKPNSAFSAIATFDIIGISKFEGKSVFAESMKKPEAAPLSDMLDRIYEPRHLNITLQNYSQIDPAGIEAFWKFRHGETVFNAWMKNVTDFPLSYLRHRGEVTRYLVGLTNESQFYPTHYSVDLNDLGVAHIENDLSRFVVYYVTNGVDKLMLRPWVIYLITILLMPFLLYFSNKKLFVITLFTSSLLYFVPMIFILPAADLRYNFWPIMSAVVCIIVGVASLSRARPDKIFK